MARPLQGKTAIVTGAARGIGAAVVAKLQSDGAAVSAWDVAERDTTIDQTDDQQLVDVSDPNSVATALTNSLANLGRIDIIVNNAGINGPTVPILDYPEDDWHRVIAVNLTGVWHCCRAVIPAMREAGGGRIINMASISGKDGNANASAYSASKGGVIALTKALAKELTADQILVNAVAPSLTATDLMDSMAEDYKA